MDKILAAAQELGMDDMSQSDDPEASEFLESSGGDDGSHSTSADEVLPDDGDLHAELDEDEKAMGKASGDPYTAADNRVIAKYIATFDNWDDLTIRRDGLNLPNEWGPHF